MHVVEAGLRGSLSDAGLARLEFTVAVERTGALLEYWVELPADLAPRTLPANATALLMLPLACHFHEDIEVDQPVDPVLLENLAGVQQIWRAWYGELRTVEIHAPTGPPQGASPGKRTLASFSGGIDSFFTLLRKGHEITDLLSIAGFNTPMDDLARMREQLDPIALKFGKRHVPVLTNIRYGRNSPTPYSIPESMMGYAHGCLLAAIAHLMEAHVGCFIIPASHHYAHLMPYGSHPLTDPLFSSAAVRVVHDGAAFDRVQRTGIVARSPDALSVLHVCWQDFTRGNCSECQKCLRTMATLDLFGAKEMAASFNWSKYSTESLASAWLPTQSERAFFAEIARAARARGRIDLAGATEAALARSRRKGRWLDAIAVAKAAVRRVVRSNAITRSLWTVTRPLRAWLINALVRR